jgi:hypothetical protein
MSVVSEKLASENGVAGISASLASSRAVFDFLTLAVRRPLIDPANRSA